MGFPRDLLAEHEDLIFELRPHWVALVPAGLWTVGLLVALLLGYRAIDAIVDGDPFLPKAIFGSFMTGLWLFFAVSRYLKWRFTLFVLTTDRLITRSGIIAKHSKEIPLERINDVTFTQSVIERLLGAGDLLLDSSGDLGPARITAVRKPEEVQLIIYKESEKNENRMRMPHLGGLQPHREPTIPEQIEALARLKDQGTLSDEEFESKKRELLGRM
ncbi:MAG: PH domain-containing protein [Actinomycetota bacterium]